MGNIPQIAELQPKFTASWCSRTQSHPYLYLWPMGQVEKDMHLLRITSQPATSSAAPTLRLTVDWATIAGSHCTTEWQSWLSWPFQHRIVNQRHTPTSIVITKATALHNTSCRQSGGPTQNEHVVPVTACMMTAQPSTTSILSSLAFDIQNR